MANRVYGYQGYKGYQFETSPRKLQPEYEPEEVKHIKKPEKVIKKTKKRIQADHPREGQVEQVRKISKEELNARVKFVCYVLFGFTVLFTISYRNSIINEKFNQKEALKYELADVQKINEQLEVGIENELNLTTVEKLAKEKLGMSKLSNSQKVYITLPKKEFVESNSENFIVGKSENAHQSIWEKIKKFLNIC